MDCIKIENLQVFARHGVYQEETDNGQNFYINAVLFTETRKAGLADELSLSTDYGQLCRFMSEYMERHTYRLIEAAAENLAQEVLLRFPLIRRLKLEIRKPEAPIGLPFESVSVEITRGWHTVFLSLGSNMGNREEYLNGALEGMKNRPGIRVQKVSEYMRTTPYGEAATDEFINGAAKIETLFTPEELLDFLHVLEAEAGRERKVHWGNRTLDLDIIFYDDLIMSTENLVIPHPDFMNRDFVLIPMAQIEPSAMDPLSHKTVKMLLDKLLKSKEMFTI